MVSENRGIVKYIILSFITLGIYAWWYTHKLAQDMNVVCEGDGENTPGLLAYMLLSMVTLGLYSYWWQYKIGNRLQANAGRYGLTFRESGTTILLWDIFGVVLCGIGPFVAMWIIMKNMNAMARAYNGRLGLNLGGSDSGGQGPGGTQLPGFHAVATPAEARPRRTTSRRARPPRPGR